MQVVSVSVRVRESKESGDGWRSLELAAEAQVYPTEDWREAQQSLYEELHGQLDALGVPRAEAGSEASQALPIEGGNHETARREPREPESAGEARDGEVVCPTHHKAKRGKYGFYCPTKLSDGSWCAWQYRA